MAVLLRELNDRLQEIAYRLNPVISKTGDVDSLFKSINRRLFNASDAIRLTGKSIDETKLSLRALDIRPVKIIEDVDVGLLRSYEKFEDLTKAVIADKEDIKVITDQIKIANDAVITSEKEIASATKQRKYAEDILSATKRKGDEIAIIDAERQLELSNDNLLELRAQYTRHKENYDLISERERSLKKLATDRVSAYNVGKESFKNLLTDAESVAVTIQRVASAINVTSFVAGIAGLNKGLKDFSLLSLAIKQSNADLIIRKKIYQDVNIIQAQTGVGIETLSRAQSALTMYGLETAKNNSANLKTIVMMNRGLDVSVDTGAELAMISTRIGANFDRVGDSVAYVAAQTALTAQEAANLALIIGKLNLTLGTTGADLGKVSAVAGLLAGEIKKLGGDPRAIENLLRTTTSMEDIATAAILGAGHGAFGGPTAAKSPEMFGKMALNLGSQLSRMADSTGRIPIVLGSFISNMYKMDIATANTIVKMHREGTLKSIQERAEMEEIFTNDLTKQFEANYRSIEDVSSRIANSISAIIKMLTSPIIGIVLSLLDKLNTKLTSLGKLFKDNQEFLNKFATAAKYVSVVVGVTLVYQFVKATKAVFGFMASLASLVKQLNVSTMAASSRRFPVMRVIGKSTTSVAEANMAAANSASAYMATSNTLLATSMASMKTFMSGIGKTITSGLASGLKIGAWTTALQAVLSIPDVISAWQEGGFKSAAKSFIPIAVDIITTTLGSVIGGAIGSLFGPAGTAIGAVSGGIIVQTTLLDKIYSLLGLEAKKKEDAKKPANLKLFRDESGTYLNAIVVNARKGTQAGIEMAVDDISALLSTQIRQGHIVNMDDLNRAVNRYTEVGKNAIAMAASDAATRGVSPQDIKTDSDRRLHLFMAKMDKLIDQVKEYPKVAKIIAEDNKAKAQAMHKENIKQAEQEEQLARSEKFAAGPIQSMSITDTLKNIFF